MEKTKYKKLKVASYLAHYTIQKQSDYKGRKTENLMIIRSMNH
jgi:hypothetical protein